MTSVKLTMADQLKDAFQIAKKAQKERAQSSLEERRYVLLGAYEKIVKIYINEIGNGMIDNPIPRLISFTGSKPVGRHIGKVAGENFNKVALELDGNAPFVL